MREGFVRKKPVRKGFVRGGLVCKGLEHRGATSLLALTLLALTLLGCRPSAPAPAAPASAESGQADTAQAPARPTLELAGARFILDQDPDDPALSPELFEAWVRRSAEMIADYYGGRFPVPSLRITLVASSGRRVGFGQHWDGRRLRIRVGRQTTAQTLERDWVMVHEMLHACYPDLRPEHRWMQEGLSTYLEPVVRARAGNISEAQLWSKWVDMMELGRPRAGDHGLDVPPRSWGRLYWGGALFWLKVDVELRKRSDNRLGLREALQGVVARGGNGRADWSIEACSSTIDEVTQTTVMSELFEAMALQPGDVELPALWRELGVIPAGDGVEFDDDAPLAHIRLAMTRA